MEPDTAPVGGAEAIPAPVIIDTPAPATTPVDAREAARQLGKWRDQQNKPVEPAPVAAPEDLAEQPDSDPSQEAPAETTDAPEPEVELPPIEAPRSWTKEEKEEFATYPREAQEKIARREQDREATFRRSQNEAADARKAIEAERAKVDQARQQYETALPALLQTLQEQQQGEFSDIKTMSDVERLAREDWPRYALWDAQQKKIAAVSAEVKAAQDRQVSEFETKWSEFATSQDQLLIDKAPELADKARAGKVSDGAISLLKDIGFKDQELAQLYHGKASMSLRDHRVQLLILDGVKYREAKANVAKPAPKPVPPVQRPGTAPSKGAAQVAQVESLAKKLETAKGPEAIRVAAQLMQARRSAQR